MTNKEMIIELQYAIDLIKQNGQDWLDERDIPILEAAISALQAQEEPKPPASGSVTCMFAQKMHDRPMDGLISRQEAIDALCRRCDLVADDDEPCTDKCNDIKILEKMPSEQPEFAKDKNVPSNNVISRQAVMALDMFTKIFCRDYAVRDDLAFRCSQCEFKMSNGKCLAKVMARKLCPDYKNFGCMGDL
jgi:hypothetical protein